MLWVSLGIIAVMGGADVASSRRNLHQVEADDSLLVLCSGAWHKQTAAQEEILIRTLAEQLHPGKTSGNDSTGRGLASSSLWVLPIWPSPLPLVYRQTLGSTRCWWYGIDAPCHCSGALLSKYVEEPK